MADERDRTADERERIADDRERLADETERAGDRRRDAEVGADDGHPNGVLAELAVLAADLSTNADQRLEQSARAERTEDSSVVGIASDPEWAEERRQFVADDRQEQADAREVLADERESLTDRQDVYLDKISGPSGALAPDPQEQVERDEAAVARDAAALARRIAAGDRAATGEAHPLAAEFVQMTRSLLQAETVEQAIVDVVEAAVRFVNGCDAASLSAYVGDVVTTLASTGPIAAEADDAQFRASDGPCLEAIRTLQLVISADLTKDERWPAFDAAPAVRSVISAPVEDDHQSGSPFGSLNSYGIHANAFTSEDADTAVLLTAHLGVLLRLATMTSEADERIHQLTEAVASRDVIGQAKGILMEREQLTAAQAFDVLRGASQRLNRKLRDVADQVATSGEMNTPAGDAIALPPTARRAPRG